MSEKKAPPATASTTSRKIIDWRSIHRRVEALDKAIADDWRPDAARTQHILAERARRLAQPIADAGPVQSFDMLEFSLGRERYGIAADHVREVFTLNDFTPVPCAPAFVIGIASVRGEVVSLVDIRRFLGIAASGITDLNKVIVIANARMVFGIVVDSIVEVRVTLADSLLAPSAINGVDARYLLGITPDHIAVLDAAALLRDEALIVDKEIN